MRYFSYIEFKFSGSIFKLLSLLCITAFVVGILADATTAWSATVFGNVLYIMKADSSSTLGKSSFSMFPFFIPAMDASM
jgi:hypothetical protein